MICDITRPTAQFFTDLELSLSGDFTSLRRLFPSCFFANCLQVPFIFIV
jgi:hypothetical protein